MMSIRRESLFHHPARHREPPEDGREVHPLRKRAGYLVPRARSQGKGKAADIDKEPRANVLPGVTIVPAMVIAIEKAQDAGIRYNRQ
jgi:hypothetical protein